MPGGNARPRGGEPAGKPERHPGTPARPRSFVSTSAEFDGAQTAGAVVQWAIRFCQSPETLPVFCAWARSIWPECPYSDAEIAEDLVRGHDFFTAVLRVLAERL